MNHACHRQTIRRPGLDWNLCICCGFASTRTSPGHVSCSDYDWSSGAAGAPNHSTTGDSRPGATGEPYRYLSPPGYIRLNVRLCDEQAFPADGPETFSGRGSAQWL